MAQRPRGRPRHTTHAQIRDIARGLFLEQGYAATSLQQIADSAGISRTTLFHYFPAKIDLMLDELEDSLNRLRAALQNSQDRPVVSAMGAAIISSLPFTDAEHDALAQRWRIVRADEELTAEIALRTHAITELLVAFGTERVNANVVGRVPEVVAALLASAVTATSTWSASDRPTLDLGQYVQDRLAPFIIALEPLLS